MRFPFLILSIITISDRNHNPQTQQKSPETFISELSLKSAATYFHKPFPANYLGHE